MTARGETRLWIAQRASAAVLALCVVVHLVVIIYAMRGGLSAAEILGRTRGNFGWAAFYTVFVLAAAVHAPIGLRTILMEWGGSRGPSLAVAAALFAVALAVLGLRAVWAVFA
ncbi:MAG TPA: succinate dehydrogenase [Burkholderiales bacterium]|nr:succinate dehydrogenase [Burkholderiales bacterium]